MEIKYGLISADSHAAFDRDDFVRRMSVSKWQDRIPRVVEAKITDAGFIVGLSTTDRRIKKACAIARL